LSAIPIAQLATWMTQEIGKDLEKNIKTAQKLIQERMGHIKDMSNAIRKLENYAKSELDKGAQELVRSTRARSTYKVARHLAEFSTSFQTALDGLKIPDPRNPTSEEIQQYYTSSVRFSRDAKNLFSKYRVILAAPWIRSKKESKELRTSFITFLEKRTNLKKFIDEQLLLNRKADAFLQLSARLQSHHQNLETMRKELNDLQENEQEILKQTQTQENTLKTLQINSNFRKWEQIQQHKYAIEQKLQKLVNPLKRALKKIENQSDAVQTFFTPRAMAQIGGYLEDPYRTFVTGENGPEILLEIAKGIQESIQAEKLVIGKARGRKGLDGAERLIRRSEILNELIEEHKKLEATIKQFRTSPPAEELFNALTKIETQSKKIETIRRELVRQKSRLKTKYAQEEKHLTELKNELEQMARELTNKSLKIIDT